MRGVNSEEFFQLLHFPEDILAHLKTAFVFILSNVTMDLVHVCVCYIN